MVLVECETLAKLLHQSTNCKKTTNYDVVIQNRTLCSVRSATNSIDGTEDKKIGPTVTAKNFMEHVNQVKCYLI